MSCGDSVGVSGELIGALIGDWPSDSLELQLFDWLLVFVYDMSRPIEKLIQYRISARTTAVMRKISLRAPKLFKTHNLFCPYPKTHNDDSDVVNKLIQHTITILAPHTPVIQQDQPEGGPNSALKNSKSSVIPVQMLLLPQ